MQSKDPLQTERDTPTLQPQTDAEWIALLKERATEAVARFEVAGVAENLTGPLLSRGLLWLLNALDSKDREIAAMGKLIAPEMAAMMADAMPQVALEQIVEMGAELGSILSRIGEFVAEGRISEGDGMRLLGCDRLTFRGLTRNA